MKKVMVMATALLIATGVWGQEFRYRGKSFEQTYNNLEMRSVWKHAYVAADTVVTTGKFRDTVYSPWMECPSGSKYLIAFYADGKHSYQENGYKDTARANDSIALRLQTCANRYGIPDTTLTIGSLLMGSTDLDSTITYVQSLVRDTCLMRFPLVRSLVVVKDSSAAARAGLVGNTYSTSFTVILRVQP